MSGFAFSYGVGCARAPTVIRHSGESRNPGFEWTVRLSLSKGGGIACGDGLTALMPLAARQRVTFLCSCKER